MPDASTKNQERSLMDEMNGGAPSQADAMKAAFENQIRQVVGVVVHGLLVSVQGIPPQVVMDAFCKAAGSLAAEPFQGDLGTILKLRAGFKKQFEEGMKTIAITPPAMPTNLGQFAKRQ